MGIFRSRPGMEFINLHVSVVDSEVFQDASPADRSTWLFLMRYCAGQENGGRIVGAHSWNDRKWLKCASLSCAEVDGERTLWTWEGEDLVVEFYPAEQEKILMAKRRGGRMAARGRKTVRETGQLRRVLEGERAGVLSGEQTGQLRRKGREGKEMEGNVREGTHVPETKSEVGNEDSEKKSPAPGAGPAEKNFHVEHSEHFPETAVPSLAEVMEWAGNPTVAVDPDYVKEKWEATQENHGWVLNGEVIDWQRKWRRYWLQDRERWYARRNRDVRQNGSAAALMKEGDETWWWREAVETVERSLAGALMSGNEAPWLDRLREIVRVRKAVPA